MCGEEVRLAPGGMKTMFNLSVYASVDIHEAFALGAHTCFLAVSRQGQVLLCRLGTSQKYPRMRWCEVAMLQGLAALLLPLRELGGHELAPAKTTAVHRSQRLTATACTAAPAYMLTKMCFKLLRSRQDRKPITRVPSPHHHRSPRRSPLEWAW